MKERISNDLSYVKAGYRSDKWKWVLSLSQGKSLVQNVAVGEPDSCEVDEPAAASATEAALAEAATTTEATAAEAVVAKETAAKETVTEATAAAEETTAAAAKETATATAAKETRAEGVVAQVVGEAGIIKPEKDALPSEVVTDKTAQKNFATQNHTTLPQAITEELLTKEQILKTYGMDKWPKQLPCQKKCSSNPWCLADLKAGTGKEKVRPTDQPRDPSTPVGLQNTANTCWINSALQALFHLPKFRNVINSVGGFTGEESLTCMLYLLQAMFVEMETHGNRAVACSPGSVFEKMGMYATQEIMCKDVDHEVLKCVSEFLENTIDTLVADPRVGPQLRPLFSTSLTRIARWKCPACEREHENQLAPATSYTMAAYVSGDECPLDQCLVDLQTETQTGVSLVCGSEDWGIGGCGARVKADRIVTPKIQMLPAILVIRNNSLMDRELKRRLHVVYPETLDLTSHTQNHVAATYSLSAVIFHHGHWVKHFSAHVKTGDKWYNFNDEQVSQLSNRSSTGNPSESHRNYFSVANVAQKYKHRPGLRVSRGAFVWIYVNTQSQAAESMAVPPSESVVEYVLVKQNESVNVNHQHQAEMRKEKEALLSQCAVADTSESYTLISEPLLSAWYNDDSLKYTPQPSVLAQALCEHKLFSPLKYNLMKCIRTNAVKELLSHPFGIHEDDALLKLGLPITLPSETGFCKVCVIKYVNHILFIERVKALHKQAKKESRRECDCPVMVIGTETLEFWPRLALSAYVKEHGIDVEDGGETENGTDTCKKSEESSKLLAQIASSDDKVNRTSDSSDVREKNDVQTEKGMNVCDTTSIVPDTECKSACESQMEETESLEKTASNSKEKEIKEGNRELMLFNEDIVCKHNLRSPTAASCKLPQDLAKEIIGLCSESIHPAIYQEDFDTCLQCGAVLEESVRNCESGRLQKKQLTNLFLEKRRPHPVRDPGKSIYLISRGFYHLWKSYVRSCERGDLVVSPPKQLENASLLCSHGHLLFPVMALEPHELSEHLVLVWEEEWTTLKELYRPDHVVTAFYNEVGSLMTDPVVCENGCVEMRLAKDYEEQFSYEHEIIHVRQVNSVTDIPRRLSGRTRGPSHVGASAALNNESLGPRKKPRLATGSGGAGGMPSSSQRLVRASRTFSSTDTIREVQNFIAERTGIWPMLQTLWVCGEEQQKGGEAEGGQPLQLTDDHRAMTLNALRIRPGDTIYFRAAVEDMERAAGDGVVEFNEMDDDW
ncbi:ubiquitin carboxyl-terminal hydrolase 48-like isoform X1 [Portunus trituberculatus]|uniref:ubiquitin carboxyl-terminal hydrolase 48-like isoform X1 n=2 Tax=Portunus trituberculatus TaxID=210409 RepID=UPI001E1CB564|nr:ubiquitin carboxyl-terminal hydrolase 48-like isoform X1 [Portunus trituberculatus]